jgi:predicted metalloprotease with PDZ domain
LKAAALLVIVCASRLPAQQSVEYDISFPNAAQHEARVIATFRGLPRGSTLHARMSRSSPGRYALATFAKNVYDVKAVDRRGRELAITRPDPHGWDVGGHDGAVRITYTVWGDRTDGTYLSIDHSHAHLNMPATFIFARGMDAAPIRLTIHPRKDWLVATQLVPTKDSTVFTAPNLQWFMDSPTEVGPVVFRSWTSRYGGKPYTWRLAVHHLGTSAELDSFAVMARSVVEEAVAMWGQPAAYDLGTYTFIADYLPWAGGDGMEHRNSTILTSTRSLADRAMRLQRLGPLSHEFFHSWSMERLRSRALEPFDFERENMSPELWFGEGFANYYGPLIIRRAGLYDDEEYARQLGEAVVATITSPARRHFSAVGMSMEAPFFDGASFLDPTNRQNIFLSYYTWGSVIALALDLTLRGQYGLSLDDYMRVLWRDYGRHQSVAWAPERPYTVSDLRAELGILTKDTTFAKNFFRRYIEGSDLPDFAKLLAPAGFLLRTDSVERPYLGASMDDDTASVFINWTAEGGSMYNAGIASGDIVFAIDGVPAMSVDSLTAIVARHRPGNVVQVDVRQREVRRTVPMTIVGRRSLDFLTYEAAKLPVTDSIREFRRSWLGSRRK